MELPTNPKRVMLVGLGANGSFLAPLLARSPYIGSLTLVDPDHYTRENLASQSVTHSGIDRSKTSATAALLREIRPELQIECFPVRVETLPLGLFRGADVIVACVDSRRVRQEIQLRAWRCGRLFIDTGVNSDEQLTRLSCFVPAAGSPCMECTWSELDYADLDQPFRCDGSRIDSVPTRSPAWLGAHAAAIAAAELDQLFGGEFNPDWAGVDIISNLRHRKHYVTTRNRNPRCRFDHGCLAITPLTCDPGRVTLGSMLREQSASALRVEPFDVATEAACPSCGMRSMVFSVAARLNTACPACDTTLRFPGYGLREWIGNDDDLRAHLDEPLSRAGITQDDVIRLRRPDGTELVHQLTAAAA